MAFNKARDIISHERKVGTLEISRSCPVFFHERLYHGLFLFPQYVECSYNERLRTKKALHLRNEEPVAKEFTLSMVNFKFNFGGWLNISGKELKGTDLISVLCFLAFCISLGVFIFNK